MRIKGMCLRFAIIPFWFLLSSILLVLLLRWVPVKYTPLMLKRAVQFRSDESYHREQKWVFLEDYPPELINAVLFCEDQRFWDHHGFDRKEMRKMLWHYRHECGPLRGCSTISQQTAKNVFTFGSHTIARKAIEAYWTFLIERLWGKNRILEVYLNVSEMGKGLYGMGVAAEHYYECPVLDLKDSQAVALAVCMTHPLTSGPFGPSASDRMKRTKIIEQSSNTILNNK